MSSEDPTDPTDMYDLLDAIEAALAAADPAKRDALAKTIDAYREDRWLNGLAYMEDRARIVETFEGETRDEELRVLRERYFAQEAPTIEAEERDGFFRFRRARVYGRN